jgi:hypothetical protein
MALLDKLLGSGNSQKVRLIRELTRFRIKADPGAQLMGIDSGQVDSLAENQLMMLPEASIATIVETYVQLIHRGVSAQSALSQIDNHRSSGFGSAKSSETANLFDYVADRMRLEHEHAGLMDQAFIDSAVFTSAKVFGMEVELPKRPDYEVMKQFAISNFRVVIAKYRRREDGYLFPWRLMAFAPGEAHFAFSYNLEVSSITCGLGSHSSDGAHLTFEEGDPAMSLEDFEAWAIPMASDHIAAIEAKNHQIASSAQQDFDVELQQLEQAYDEGEIDHLEYKTKRNKLVMDSAASAYKSANFDQEHAKNVIAYEDGDITLEQHLENYRALLLSEVTKVLMDRLDSPSTRS